VILVNLMMKANSKIISILVILLIAGLLTPTISLAKQNKGREWSLLQRNSENAKNKQFCNQLENWADKIDQNITERQAKVSEKQTERLQKLNERKENRDAKLEQHREKWEEKWQEHFDILENKASTSVERQAMVEFNETVKEAMASRQAAVDEAISDFREALAQIVNNRKIATEQARIEYQNAYQAAVAKAKADCVAGVEPAQVRETLKAVLKTAREEFEKDRRTIEKLDLKSLVEARQQAFREALDYFKRVMQESRADLRAAFNLEEEED